MNKGKARQKLFTRRKIIPPKWDSLALGLDLTWAIWIHSHKNDLFLQSKIHYSNEISLRWNVSSGEDGFSHINSSLEQLFWSGKWLLPIAAYYHDKEVQSIDYFYRLFGCPTANFGPLLRGQSHSSDVVNHCVFKWRPQGSLITKVKLFLR